MLLLLFFVVAVRGMAWVQPDGPWQLSTVTGLYEHSYVGPAQITFTLSLPVNGSYTVSFAVSPPTVHIDSCVGLVSTGTNQFLLQGSPTALVCTPHTSAGIGISPPVFAFTNSGNNPVGFMTMEGPAGVTVGVISGIFVVYVVSLILLWRAAERGGGDTKKTV